MINMNQLADIASRSRAFLRTDDDIEIGPGWYELLMPVLDLMECINRGRQDHDKISFSNIKEKFGLLRICLKGEDIPQELKDAVKVAESRYRYYCEYCGSNNTITTEGKTMCASCRKFNVRMTSKTEQNIVPLHWIFISQRLWQEHSELSMRIILFLHYLGKNRVGGNS